MKLLSIHLKTSEQFFSSAPETFEQICRFIYQTWKSMGNKPLKLLYRTFEIEKALLSLNPNEGRGEQEVEHVGRAAAGGCSRSRSSIKTWLPVGSDGKTACWAFCSAHQRRLDGFMLWRMIRYHLLFWNSSWCCWPAWVASFSPSSHIGIEKKKKNLLWKQTLSICPCKILQCCSFDDLHLIWN